MHFWSSSALVLLVLLIDFGSSGNTTIHCNKDTQCTVTDRICALCTPNKYPSCTSPICINNQCGTLGPCSLQLNGNCTSQGYCILDPICKKCKQYQAPNCSEAKCFNNRCAYIAPCSIPLQH